MVPWIVNVDLWTMIAAGRPGGGPWLNLGIFEGIGRDGWMLRTQVREDEKVV